MTRLHKAHPFLGLLSLFILIASSGCKKLLDYFPNHANPTNCRISKFYSSSNYPAKTGTIYYNKHGNPVSVVFDEGMTGQSDYYFMYDKKQRLTDCIAYYPGTYDTLKDGTLIPNSKVVIQQWHMFQYDKKDRMIGDTTWGEVIYEPGNPRPLPFEIPDSALKYAYIIRTFTYDAWERIIKVDFKNFEVNYSKAFSYGPDGNLIKLGRKYDSNLSYLQTHKIWMLLNLDYSINNPVPAAEYNSKGLPTKFDVDRYEQTDNNFLYTNLDKSTIQYDCK